MAWRVGGLAFTVRREHWKFVSSTTTPIGPLPSGDPKLLHLVNQRSAFQAKFRGCAFRAADHPTDSFKRVQNQSAFGVFQSNCGRRDADTWSACRWQRIRKHAIV